uniref:Reverse transcriptase domain-containing protein n=1 Tax=Aegilops tauschii subsp. strangulata TaxID=200361 RepID=A0A453R6L1_AEGTS
MYRPICMLNVPFEFFTKVLNTRAMLVAYKLVSKIQFIEGPYLLDNVVMLHETIHYAHKSKLFGVLFKVNFEKAYDKIN